MHFNCGKYNVVFKQNWNAGSPLRLAIKTFLQYIVCVRTQLIAIKDMYLEFFSLLISFIDFGYVFFFFDLFALRRLACVCSSISNVYGMRFPHYIYWISLIVCCRSYFISFVCGEDHTNIEFQCQFLENIGLACDIIQSNFLDSLHASFDDWRAKFTHEKVKSRNISSIQKRVTLNI